MITLRERQRTPATEQVMAALREVAQAQQAPQATKPQRPQRAKRRA
jgi:hypothetical protein